MHAPRSTVRRLLPAAVVAVALAGCTDGSSASPEPSASPTGTPAGVPTPSPVEEPTTPPTSPAEAVRVDWNDPALDVPLAGGWSLRDCIGDAPMLCVNDGDELLGLIEAMRSPLGDELAAILRAEGPHAALRRYVDDYHETFTTDRAAGCAEGYGYEQLHTETVVLAGSPALRYGFAGIAADGTEAERNISYVAIVGDQLEIVTVLSNTTASCVYSDTMIELDPSELRQLEPELDALMAGSILPA